MKNLITLLTVLFITTSISAQSKEEKLAKNRTDELVDVLSLDKEETEKVYSVLLEKEKEVTILREKHKGDKESYKAGNKALNKTYNRKMKDFLGGERMSKMHAYYKAKRTKLKS